MSEQQEGASLEIQEEVVVQGGRRRIGIIIGIAILGLVIIGGLVYWQYASRIISTDDATINGDVVDVSAKVGGRLEKIDVKEEQKVEKGQVVAELDLVPLQLALNQAQAAYEQAQANYAKLPDDIKSADVAVTKAQEMLVAAQAAEKSSKLALDDAERIFNQDQALYDSGALSKDAYQTSKNKYDTAQANFESAQANTKVAQGSLDGALAQNDSTQNTSGSIYEAQLKQAKANMDVAQYNFDNATIKAPSAGTVVRVPLQAGENISAGVVILSICDLDSTYITANVDEKDIGRIKLGQKVDITIDSYPGKTITGKVDSIGTAAQSYFALIPTQSTSGNYTKVTQYLPIKIIPTIDGLVLRPGMSAVVKIHIVT